MKGILRDSIRAGNDYKVPAGINHIRAHKASRSVPLTGISVPLTGINVGIRSENKRRRRANFTGESTAPRPKPGAKAADGHKEHTEVSRGGQANRVRGWVRFVK
jgi:hypothetical protein